MIRWHCAFAIWTALVAVCKANEMTINESDDEHQRCQGMYSKDAWGGSTSPYVETVFEKYTVEDGSDPMISIVIFEWKDEPLIGKKKDGDQAQMQKDKEYICTPNNIQDRLCNNTEMGEFILVDGAKQKAQATLFTQAVHLRDAAPIKYEVKKTGYYCVATSKFTANDYKGVVEFRNAYGELPAAQIAKLPFYGGLTILYAVIGAFWAFLYVQHRHDILAVQNYITAIIIFLIIEMLMTWGFYDYQNRHGSNALAKALMIIVAILNAARNSFSFFLLLIVCMGYGVVKHTLGKTMLYVRGLAIAHFVFGVIYAVASFTVTPDTAGPLVLLVILPLTGTLTAFYIWTLNSLKATMKDLVERKQHVKALMYKKLSFSIIASILVIFGFFFLNSFTFAGHSNPEFVPYHWKTRWFILDGWLNLVYLVDLCIVAYLWRPTANNRRFAMSDEIAQDDEFEFGSVRGSLDEESASGANTPRATVPNGNASQVPKPAVNSQRPRESLDHDETIFAVGEEDGDKSSEDGAPRNSSERKRLTNNKT